VQWGEADKKAAGKIYSLLGQISHMKLTGQTNSVQPGTFWLPN